MRKSVKDKIAVKGFDDLFGDGMIKTDGMQVVEIPLSEIDAFENHPFKVLDNTDMQELVKSVREDGILSPGLARTKKDGRYEMISGHRRKHAAEIVGLSTMPLIIREVDDDNAVVAMVNANLQREEILPSEKAFSYKMKLEALKHQGRRSDKETEGKTVKLDARRQVAQDAGESAVQIQRYIRLTELVRELLDMVDDKRIGFTSAGEISYLSIEEQNILLSVLNETNKKLSVSHAGKLRELSGNGSFTREAVVGIFGNGARRERRFVMKQDRISEYFPEDVSEEEIEQTIFKLLDDWKERKVSA